MTKRDSPHRFLESLADEVPVDDVVKGGDVFGASILVLQIVGMLPNIDPEERSAALGKRVVLVWGRLDFQIFAVQSEPGPAAAKLRGRSCREFLLEGHEAAE